MIPKYKAPKSKKTNTYKEKKVSKKKQDKTNMSIWAFAVKERAGNRCEYCGKETYLNAHHFYSRSDYKLRYDIDNGFCLCSGCHTLSSKFSAHKTPADFIEWAIKYRGKSWYKKLQKKHWSCDLPKIAKSG